MVVSFHRTTTIRKEYAIGNASRISQNSFCKSTQGVAYRIFFSDVVVRETAPQPSEDII